MGMPTQTGKTVLIVADEAEGRGRLTLLFRAANDTVVEAGNGTEALSYLQCRPRPDLIVLDFRAPAVDGWLFLRALRRAIPGFAAPILITTADVNADRAWALSHGCAEVVKKPLAPQELLETVARLTRRRPGP
jgi:twitching motility two-component system response regulator PilH